MDDYLLFLGVDGDYQLLGENNSAYGLLLQVHKQYFLIDPGPGSYHRALEYQIQPADIQHLLLTHNHLHHIHDSSLFIYALTQGCTQKEGHLYGPKSLFAKAPRKPHYLPNYFRSHVKNHHSLKPGETSRFVTTEIKATPVEHPDGGVGYRIQTPYQTISYVGDTSLSKKVVEAHLGTTILILNCKNPLNIDEKGQLNTQDTQRFIELIQPQVVFLNHIGYKLRKMIAPIDLARELQKKTGVNVVVAKEGIRTTLFQYISKERQKTLESY